jgi:hypothetical protein
VDAINALGTELLQYVIPPLLFIKIFGTKKIFQSIGASICMLIGVGALICSVYGAIQQVPPPVKK